MEENNLGHLTTATNNIEARLLARTVESIVFNQYKATWENQVQADDTRNGRNKLRQYRLFKKEYRTEAYVNRPLPRSHRTALAKFRCGVAPLKIETGRYENIPVENRHCFNCTEKIEDELHALLLCPFYEDERKDLLDISTAIYPHFNMLSDLEKLCLFLESPNLIFYTARTCHLILSKRRSFLYK